MVMDVWEHQLPSGMPHRDSAYILEVNTQDDEPFPSRTLLGVFDCLEGALHAMDHLRKFRAHGSHSILKVKDSLVVTRVRKNTATMHRSQLVTWERGEDDPVRHGCSTGQLDLHSGLRTHAVEQG